MKKNFQRIFLKTFIWLAPINAVLSVIFFNLSSGFFNEMIGWIFSILNFPAIMLVVYLGTGFLKSPNVNWYIASPLLSLFDSFLWAVLIAFVIVAVSKKKRTEPIA